MIDGLIRYAVGGIILQHDHIVVRESSRTATALTHKVDVPSPLEAAHAVDTGRQVDLAGVRADRELEELGSLAAAIGVGKL